jgi:hypothetical protein
MQPHTQLTALVLAAMVMAVPVRPLEAQTERQDPHVRNDCRLAGQVVETGHPAPHYQWALEFVRHCEVTGPPVLVALWSRPPSDADHLNQLFLSSYRLRDSRVTAAAVEAAGDPGLPRIVRLAAIRVLAGHAVPEFLLSNADLLRQDSDSARSMFPSVDHATVRNGESPVDECTIRDILTALAGIGDDADAQVARAAMHTRQQVCLRLRRRECV